MGKDAGKVTNLPTPLTIVKAIALADGKLRWHKNYMTKYQMITLCKKWLARRALSAGKDET